MKINSFRAKNVHGYLNFDISFSSNITFLIGINGSGKTSALKLLLGLTSPSYSYLNQITYDFCEVICSSREKERDIIIKAEQNKNEGSFTLSLNFNNEKYRSKPIKRFLKNEALQFDNDDFSQIEQRNREFFEENEVTQRIRRFTTPKFLGLDRRIYEGFNSDGLFRKRHYTASRYQSKKKDGFPDTSAIDTSLEEVQVLIFDYIRQIPHQQFQISDSFKGKLFREYFKFNEDSSGIKMPTMKDIEEKRDKILKAISDLGIKHIDYSINNFFAKTEVIARELEELGRTDPEYKSQKFIDLFIKWSKNETQLKRIDEIILYSQDYQEAIAKLKLPLKKLEELISNFLKEGKKRLIIESDGELKIQSLNGGRKASVFELSSGEKQIIIMIAHLIFEEAQKPSGIFIVDEPELSLHIAWQEIFVKSIMQASPETQFILATHSPSIVSTIDQEKYCQDLSKLNY